MKGVKSHLEDSSPLNLALSDIACDVCPLPPTIIVEFSELKMTQRLLIPTFPLESPSPTSLQTVVQPKFKEVVANFTFLSSSSISWLSVLEVLAS